MTADRVTETEERLRSIIENSQDLIQSVAPDGSFLMVNRAWRQALGYREDEIAALNVFQIIHPDCGPHCQAMFNEVMAGRTLTGVETMFITKDGRTLHVEGNVGPRIIDGAVVSTEGFFRDITARREAESTLRESEEKHRLLYESSRDAIMTLAPPDWRFTSGNPATIAMFRANDEAEFTSRGPWELSPEHQPDGRPSGSKAKEMIEKAMREGVHFFEWVHRRLDGENFPATVLLTRFAWRGDLILQATVRDITEQVKAGIALERTRLMQQAILDSAGEGIYGIDMEGHAMFLNAAAVRMLGWTPSEVGGRNFHNLTHHTRADGRPYPASECPAYAARTGTVIESADELFWRRDGTSFPVTLKGTPLRTASGEIIGAVVTFSDDTVRRRAEYERERLIGELKDALAHVKTLSGIIPICMHCKKIRDDKGYWGQVEAFVRDHTEAEFSHGICPDCLARYYPEDK